MSTLHSPLSLHDVAFVPMFELHANAEQRAKWWQDIVNYRIIGCYAQTELGHGTFVRGLETTAEYDPSAEQFVLNTPHLTSTKWWSGTREHSLK